jgi:hypothetical protein
MNEGNSKLTQSIGLGGSESRTTIAVISVLALVPWLVGILYSTLGFYRLVITDVAPFACDLHFRWEEMLVLVAGRNPCDLIATNYPPWGYGAGLFLVPPLLSWTIVRIYFGGLNLMAMLFVVAWSYHVGRAKGALAGAWLAGIFLAFTANFYCLSNGQYGILVLCFLVAALCLDRSDHPVAAGVMCGLALIKPHLSAFFFLAFLFKGKWRAVAACLITVAVLSAIAGILAHTNPFWMVWQMREHGQAFGVQAQGLVSIMTVAGMNGAVAMLVMALVGFVAGTCVIWSWRKADMLALFAIASVAGLLWSYHKAYDVMTLLFLVAALFQVGACKPTMINRFVFCAAVFTVVLPIRIQDHNLFIVQVAENAVWLTGVIVILINTRRSETGQVRLAV